jgi:hypothetical protein
MLQVQAQVTTDLDFVELWDWYADRLVHLQDELQSAVDRRGIPYQINKYDPLKVALARVRAILSVIPGVTKQEV